MEKGPASPYQSDRKKCCTPAVKGIACLLVLSFVGVISYYGITTFNKEMKGGGASGGGASTLPGENAPPGPVPGSQVDEKENENTEPPSEPEKPDPGSENVEPPSERVVDVTPTPTPTPIPTPAPENTEPEPENTYQFSYTCDSNIERIRAS